MNQEKVCSNTHECICPNNDCKNHGHCCDCVATHRGMGNTPLCFEQKEQEQN